MRCTVYRGANIRAPGAEEITRLVRATLMARKKANGCVRVHLVGPERMKALNRQYRGKDTPTDVLSFPLQEGDIIDPEDWGDVFLCPQYIRRQAKRFRVPFREESTRSLVHGLLHLSGHDHETKQDAARMFRLQERIVTTFL